MIIKLKRILTFSVMLISMGCSTLNNKKELTYSITEQPKEFKSPLIILDKSLKEVSSRNALLSKKINFHSKEWFNSSASRQNWETLFYTQKNLEDSLLKAQSIHLETGQSYSFELESFCIDPYKESPYPGEGLRMDSIPDKYQSWMPELLKKYSMVGLSQEAAQVLIWALVSDSKFDELSDENQKNLLKIFPDAMIRFGKRRLENLAKDAIKEIISDDAKTILNKIEKIRTELLSLQGDYKALEKIMVPPSKQTSIEFNQWIKLNEGYYIKLTAFGYKNVRVDIYVPEDQDIRKPQGLTEIIFNLDKLIGIPATGQRIAISPKSTEKEKPKNRCEQLSQYKVPSCDEMTDSDRKRILALADPQNFPNTRYAKPPSLEAEIESETDCSHFVDEIYKRAGFEYPYTATGEMECLNQVFKEDTEENALPGDLVLFEGHIGILDEEGLVISATRGGERNRSKLDPNDKDFLSSITKNKKNAFGNKRKILKWNCH